MYSEVNATKPIIEQIEKITSNIPGWTPIDQLHTLFNLIYTSSDLEGDIIEIGSWCGRSTVILGLASNMIGNTKVHCFDLFPEKNDWCKNDDGTYSFKVLVDDRALGAYEEQTVWKEPFENEIAPLYEKNNGILEIFQNTINMHGMENIVCATKGDSKMISKSVPSGFKCKLAFIDGDHSYDAVCNDIRNIEPYLVKGAWICFDDAFSHYDGVNSAIVDLIINNPRFELSQQMTRKLFIARRK